MLILCSNGLTSEALLSQVKEVTAPCKTAALVVTADPVYKENNYHVGRCIKELQSLGLSVDTFDLDKASADALLTYDVVEFIGGNPFYLLDAIRKSGAQSVLRTVAKDKILIGWSAAVFVFGPTLALVNRYTPEMNEVGLTDLTALGLTETECLPHYSKFLKRMEGFEETCKDYEAEFGKTVVRLNDGEGILLKV